MKKHKQNNRRIYTLITALLMVMLLFSGMVEHTYALASFSESSASAELALSSKAASKSKALSESDIKKVNLTEEEERYIEENPTVTVSMDTSWVPYCYATNDNDVVDGILPNLYKAIADNVGLKVTFSAESTYMKALEAGKAGKTQLISGIANDPKMAEKNDVNITNPYVQIYYSAVTKQSTDNLYDTNENYKVAVCKGSYATMAMKEKMDSYDFIEYNSNEECMNAVLKDEVDMTLVATHSVDYYMGKHEYSELHTVMIDDFTWGLCIGINKDCDPILVDILNKGIAAMTDNERNQAMSSGLVSATADTKGLDDLIYAQPLAAIGIVAVMVALVLIIIFLTVLRIRNREQNRKLEAALQDAEQANQSKTEFLSRISHDMRTPLNGILGMTYLSKDDESLENLKLNIDKIDVTGHYLLGLINDTLDFQKIESGRMTLEKQIIDTPDLLAGIVDMIKPMADQKHIDFRVENLNADFEWYIRMDPVRTKQIFVNLLSNAVKFTPEGGTVLLQIQCLGREGMISHNQYIVKDTGIGMSEAFLKDGIFKAFSQEHSMESANQGTGLGLSITKKLVELMGGSIEVESEPGCGTTFTILLDMERVDKEEAERELHSGTKKSQKAKESLSGSNILLVEDHPLNAEIATKLLQRAGCVVTWKENGQEAVNECRTCAENAYDVILMDIRMPVLDGLSATKEIRALEREDMKTIPIIAMTANAYEGDMRSSKDVGMTAHLSKPIEPAKMYEVIARYIQS